MRLHVSLGLASVVAELDKRHENERNVEEDLIEYRLELPS